MTIRLALTTVALATSVAAFPALAQNQPVIGLITKTETNPFFVKMKEGAAEARSEERRVGKECNLGCSSRWSPYH